MVRISKMEYSELSKEAKEIIDGMVELCVNNGYAMGINEGWDFSVEPEQKLPFRKELELFCKRNGTPDSYKIVSGTTLNCGATPRNSPPLI